MAAKSQQGQGQPNVGAWAQASTLLDGRRRGRRLRRLASVSAGGCGPRGNQPRGAARSAPARDEKSDTGMVIMMMQRIGSFFCKEDV